MKGCMGESKNEGSGERYHVPLIIALNCWCGQTEWSSYI